MKRPKILLEPAKVFETKNPTTGIIPIMVFDIRSRQKVLAPFEFFLKIHNFPPEISNVFVQATHISTNKQRKRQISYYFAQN